MTLDELNAHLFLIQKLNTAREMLQSMRGSVLGSSNLDGMPRAQKVGDKVASLAIKCTEQEEVVSMYERLVQESEPPIKAWISQIQDNRLNLIFYLRFLCGYEWQAVADVIGGKNTESAVKTACYRYLQAQNGT